MTETRIAEWLLGLGLGEHADAFAARQIDLDGLRGLSVAALDGLGITDPAQRARLLQAIAALPAVRPPIAWPAGLPGDALPSYLAAPLAALLVETHPRVRLHWLIDCAEIALRWSVALALAETIQAHQGALPDAIVARIRGQIERPSLGHWLGMLDALSTQPLATAALPPALFALYRDQFAPAMRADGRGGGTLETSLLVLRNQLYHGGGLSTPAAQALLTAHQDRVFGLLRAVAGVTRDASIIALDDGRPRRLHGPQPTSLADPAMLPPPLQAMLRRDGAGPDPADRPTGPWLTTATIALPLWPLAEFGPVLRVDADGHLIACPGGATPQMYLRADARAVEPRLTYTPLGRDELISQRLDLAAFRALFRLADPVAHPRAAGDPLHWRAFFDEATIEAEDLIGRAAELQHVKAWLKGRNTRLPDPGTAAIGWLSGRPGIGKSLLMAKVAADFRSPEPAHQAVYFHQFHGGDARNSPRAFALGLLAALDHWPLLPRPPADAEAGDPAAQPDDRLFETLRKRLEPIAALTAPNPRSAPPRLLVLLDGLDEVARLAPWLPGRLRRLALPGTLWLLAGRPEPALQQTFSGPGCEALFPDGLPPLPAADVRAMLLDGLAQGRHRLVARDQDQPDGVSNPFIDRVVAAADGLPLYVTHVLDDLLAGRLTAFDEARLPAGLLAYYDDLTERYGLSDLAGDRKLAVALLARADEPLDVEALALLLGDEPDDAPRYGERVARVARASATLLRAAATPDGTSGLTLYHQSFRDYVGGQPAEPGQPAGAPAPALAGSVTDAECKLYRRAAAWPRLPPGNLRNHLFRWGVRYALRWQGAAGLEAARERLTDFTFLQALTAELPASNIGGLVADYAAVLARLPDGPNRDAFRRWEAFFREREHLLRRGDQRWPANRILLQLAVEHADDSPVTEAAVAWLKAGHGDWVWWRNARRPRRVLPDPCLRVLSADAGPVRGLAALDLERVLAWDSDRCLRVWDWRAGRCLATAGPAAAPIDGALGLAGERLLSWGSDGTLQLWDAQRGDLLKTLNIESGLTGVLAHPNGRLICWGSGWLDRPVLLWDTAQDAPVRLGESEQERSCAPVLLPDGRILAGTKSGLLRFWDGETGDPLDTRAGHTQGIDGALGLADGRLLTWAGAEVRLWPADGEAPPLDLVGHTGAVNGALALRGGRLLTWGDNHSPRLWDGLHGEPLATLAGHFDPVRGAVELSTGHLITWSHDPKPFLWDGRTGALIRALGGHDDRLRGAALLPGGDLLSWSFDQTLRVWNGCDGTPRTRLEGHSGCVRGALAFEDADGPRILSWAEGDGDLRLWAPAAQPFLPAPAGHLGAIRGVRWLAGERLVTWGDDGTLRLWDGATGVLIDTLMGHRQQSYGDPVRVRGAEALPDGRVVSWADGRTPLLLWNPARADDPRELGDHSGRIEGVQVLPDGRFVTWGGDQVLRLWTIQPPPAPPRWLARFGKLYHRRASNPERIINQRLSGHTGAIQRVWFLPAADAAIWQVPGRQGQGGRLLSQAWDEGLRLWDAATGACLATLPGNGRYETVEVCPLDNGRFVTWGDRGQALALWDTRTGASLATLTGHEARIRGVAALPAGRLLSWSDDGTLRFWHSDAAAPLAVCRGHTGPVRGARPLPDGRILSWSDDRTLRLWQGADGTPLAVCADLATAIDGADLLTDGRILGWGADGALWLWDPDSGAAAAIPADQAPWQAPGPWLERQRRVAPDLVTDNAAAWALCTRVGIASPDCTEPPPCWQAPVPAEPRRLLGDGTLLLTLADGGVCCLQLFRGARRIDLADLARGGLSPRAHALTRCDRAIEAALASFDDTPAAARRLAERYLERGRERYRQHGLEAALDDYDHAVRHCEAGELYDPSTRLVLLRACTERGLVRTLLGRHDSALTDLDRAIALGISLNTDQPVVREAIARVYDCRGFARARQGGLTAAVEDYRVALDLYLTLDASSAHQYAMINLYDRRGTAWAALKRYDLAATDQGQVIALCEGMDVNDPAVRAALGRAQLDRMKSLFQTGLWFHMIGEVRRFWGWHKVRIIRGFSQALLSADAAPGDHTGQPASRNARLIWLGRSRWYLAWIAGQAAEAGQLDLALALYGRAGDLGSRRAKAARAALCARPWYLWGSEGLAQPPACYTGRLPNDPNPDWQPSGLDARWAALTGEAARPHLDALASVLVPSGNDELLHAVEGGILAMRHLPLPFLPGWTSCELLFEWRGRRAAMAFLSSPKGAYLRVPNQFHFISFLKALGVGVYSTQYFQAALHYFPGRLHLIGYIQPINERAQSRLELDAREASRGSRRSPWWVWCDQHRAGPPQRYPGRLPSDAAPDWPAPPPISGDWSLLTGEAARPWLDALWSLLRDRRLGPPALRRQVMAGVLALRTRPLACFPGWRLCEALVVDKPGTRSIPFLGSTDGALLLRCESSPFPAFVRALAVALEGPESYLDYLKFIHTVVSTIPARKAQTMGIGGWRVIESGEEIDFPDLLKGDKDEFMGKASVRRAQVTPPYVISLSEDGATIAAWIALGGGQVSAVAKAVFHVSPHGGFPRLRSLESALPATFTSSGNAPQTPMTGADAAAAPTSCDGTARHEP